MKTLKTKETAHIIVDYQNDFVKPWAPLYVPWAENLEIQILKNIVKFNEKNIGNVFTMDRHNKFHKYLASKEWVKPFTKIGDEIYRPDHCMRDTEWAKLYWELWKYVDRQNTLWCDMKYSEYIQKPELQRKFPILHKWTWIEEKWYSGFENGQLDRLLKSNHVKNPYISNEIKNLFVSWVATDYCVLATVLDALKLGYQVFVLADCIKWIWGNIVMDNDEERIEEVRLQIEDAWWYVIDSDDIYFAENNGDKDSLVIVKAWRKVDLARANYGICA